MDKVGRKFCFFIGTDRHHDEIVIFRQAKSLLTNNYDVTYVVSDDEDEEEINGVTVVGSGYKSTGYIRRAVIAPLYLYRKLRQINADIYQTCSIDQIFTCLLLKLYGKKIIFHLREGHPFTYYKKSKNPMWLKKIIVFFMSQWMKYALRAFDAVFVVTDDVMKYVKRWGIKKAYLQGNFPIVNKDYSLSYEEYLSRENRIIYYGSIYGISCQEYMLKALTNIDNVKYLLAGRFWGNEAYHNKLISLDKWKDVEFIDGFKIEELPSLLGRSTISNVLRDFSKTESPNGSIGIIKLYESMEAALPIICSDVSLYREMMKEYKCGILVDPKDPSQIEKAIRLLISDKRMAYEMGQNGRKAVIEKYSWDAESKKYLAVINEIVE